MAVRTNCWAYTEIDRIEYIPGTLRQISTKYRECRILRRMYCAFEECTYYKTQKQLDEERWRCEQRLKRLEEEKKRECELKGKGGEV